MGRLSVCSAGLFFGDCVACKSMTPDYSTGKPDMTTESEIRSLTQSSSWLELACPCGGYLR